MNMHLGKARGESGAGTDLEMAVFQPSSPCDWTASQDLFAVLKCVYTDPLSLCPLVTRADSGTQSQGREEEYLDPGLYVLDFSLRIKSGRIVYSHVLCLWAQQSWVTDLARGQLHASCSLYLCRRWWPWLNWPSWELGSSVKWWAAFVELFSRGKLSQPGIYCVYFPAVFNTPFRMMQVFLFFFFSSC